MHTYTCAYSVKATNVSVATLSAAFAAIPRDTNTESTLGLTAASDTVTNAGGVVTRTIVYDSAPGPLGDPGTKDALANFYTETFSQKLSTRVVAAPVVFS